MKSTFKRIVAFLICMVLVFGFAACGQKKEEETTTKADESATQVTETTTVPTTAPTTTAPQTEQQTAAKKESSKKKTSKKPSGDKSSSKQPAKPVLKSASGKPLPPKKQKPKASSNGIQPIFEEINEGPAYEGSQSKGLCDVFLGSVGLDVNELFPYRHADRIIGCDIEVIYVFYPDGDVCIYTTIHNLDDVYNSCVSALEGTAHLEGTEVTPELKKEFQAAAKDFTDVLKKSFPPSQTLKYKVSGQTITYSDGSSENFEVRKYGLILTDEFGDRIYLARMNYKV